MAAAASPLNNTNMPPWMAQYLALQQGGSPDQFTAATDPATDPTGGLGATQDAGAAPPPASNIYGAPASPTYTNTPNANQATITGNNFNYDLGASNQINQEATGELNYYSPLQQQAQQQEETALGDLNKTPGYTAPEQSQINVDYSQFKTPESNLQSQFLTPEEQSSIAGDPNAPVNTVTQGTQNEGAQLGAYEQNLSGQVGNLANYTGAAVGDLKSGLADSQKGFSSLDSAVNNPGLAFDPNNTEKQITDADMNDLTTAAGTSVGNQFRTAEDQLQRSAAAAGNTSPLAIAAANARLQTQEAASSGDAEALAKIAALQAQEKQATSIEGQRESAANMQTGYKANAATTEEAAAQNAAALAGTQGLGAAEKVGQAGIDAANQYGTEAINEQNTLTNQDYAAQNNAEQEAAARAATLAGNRQATQTGVNNTEYNQGTGTAQLTSGGAQTVGNADIAGKAAYRSGVAGQQQQAQQGGETAVGQQQSAYGTTVGALGTGTTSLGNYRNGQPSVIGDISSILGSVTGAAKAIGSAGAGAAAGGATGDVITEPQVRWIAEKEPEIVMPLRPRYRSNSRMAA